MRRSLERLRVGERAMRHPLDYPLFPIPIPRIAVLGAEVRSGPDIHCLSQWTPASLAEIRPMALAGSWRELAVAGRLSELGVLSLPDLLYPIVVFSDPATAPLNEHQHALLWDWFGLPTYEQIRDSSGRLLAYECDARDGFHLATGIDARNLGAHVEENGCPCGAREPLVRLAACSSLAAGD